MKGDIHICSLVEMPHHVCVLRPRFLVSLLEPEFQPATPDDIHRDHHLRVEVADISEHIDGFVLPGEDHIRSLVQFLQRRSTNESVLFHCHAGVSRSSAAALVAMVADAEGRELEAAMKLRQAAPHARPNERIIELADRILGRKGRMVAALEAMGSAVPVLEAPLVSVRALV
jgi:predicted protein tyrosine phosphatase